MSWNINSWLAPYATAQGLVIHNRLQMSDSASFDEDSKTLIDDSGLAFGATGALGLEIRTRSIANKAQLFFYGETGASAATAINFSLQGAGANEGDINIRDLGMVAHISVLEQAPSFETAVLVRPMSGMLDGFLYL